MFVQIEFIVGLLFLLFLQRFAAVDLAVGRASRLVEQASPGIIWKN